MAKPRRTRADRDAEGAAAERRAWDVFRAELATVRTFVVAQAMVLRGPPPDEPGRRYYSNLGFFLGAFAVPAGSDGDERALYAGLVERLEAAGALKAGVAPGILAAIRGSLTG